MKKAAPIVVSEIENGKIDKTLHLSKNKSDMDFSDVQVCEPFVLTGASREQEYVGIYLGIDGGLMWIDIDGNIKHSRRFKATFVRYLGADESVTMFGSAIPLSALEEARQGVSDVAKAGGEIESDPDSKSIPHYNFDLPKVRSAEDIKSIPNGVPFIVKHCGERDNNSEKICINMLHNGERYILGEVCQRISGMHPPYWTFIRYATNEDLSIKKRNLPTYQQDPIDI